MKSVFSVLYNNVPISINVTHQTKVSNVKDQLSVKLGIPPSSIILSYNGKKIHNSNYLYYYFCSDDSETIVFTATTTLKSDKNTCIQFFGGIQIPEEMKNAITEITSGLQNYDPKRAEEGMGGTYFLKNYNGENIYCFKPQDEEPMAPNNPHDFVGPFGSTGLRSSIKSGWSCIREVAAYYMDKNHFSGVPPTTLAEMTSKSFNYNNSNTTTSSFDNKYIPKLGSLQKFVECDDLLIDRSSNILSVMDIHKIGILDIRILNLDRNEENILLKQMGRSKVTNEIVWKAIPIDHGYSIPSSINIGWCDWCWFEYPQAKIEFDKETKEYIKSINVEEDIMFLREKLKINEVCLKNLRISNLLLQIGVDRGLTLYEIAYMMLRLDTNMERPSILEECCELSETLLEMSLKNMKERGSNNNNNNYKTSTNNKYNNNNNNKYNLRVNTNFDEIIPPSPEISPHQTAGSVLSELNEEINKKEGVIIPPNQSPLSDTLLLIDTPQMSPMLVGSFMNNNNNKINNNNLNGFSLDNDLNMNLNNNNNMYVNDEYDENKELSFGSFNDNIFNNFSINNPTTTTTTTTTIINNNNNNKSIFETINNNNNIKDERKSKSEPTSTKKTINNNNNIFSLVTSPLLQPSYEISMDCSIPALIDKIQSTNNNNNVMKCCTNKPPLNPDDLPVDESMCDNNNNENENEILEEDKCTPLVSKSERIDNNALVRTCSYTANYTVSKSYMESKSNSNDSNNDSENNYIMNKNQRSKTPNKNKRINNKDDEKDKLFFFHLKEVLINQCDMVKQRNLCKNRKLRNYSVT